MPKKGKAPLEKILRTRQTLRLYAEHGEAVFKNADEKKQALIDAGDCLAILMDFRNIINGMVDLTEEPCVAVLPYLDE